MFRRIVLPVVMLGLGSMLGYAAAWGPLPLPAVASAAEPAQQPSKAAPDDCCALPESAVLFQEGGKKEWQMPKPGNPRGSTTGPTAAPGYDHPNQFMVTKPKEIAP